MFAAGSGVAAASGFALVTQSGSGLGNAYAGATAGAEDASTIFFNPAGMARLHGKQLALAAHLLGVESRFSDTGSVAAAGRALGTSPDISRLAWIPNVYFASEISPKLHIGTGINSPFGSSGEYRADWIGRFQALKSSIETVNLNPSLSYQMNDAVSIGAGLDYQRLKVGLSNATKVGLADGITTLNGSDQAWGYNFGGLMRLADNSQIGVSYRSPIQFKLSGTAFTSSAVTIPGVTNVAIPIAVDLNTPDTLSIGYFKQMNDKWEVMADLARTGWSSFRELKVVRVSTGAPLALTPENWSDTWRVALGANHHYNERWTARVGMAYDQSPVPDAFRTARLPDSDRTWLSLGGQYKTGKGGVLDFGYAHLFFKKSAIDRNKGGVDTASSALYARLAGSYDTQADILSAQYTRGF